MKRRNRELREKFVERALQETGYTARANGTSFYGERVGYTGNGLPWDGAFIDVVARECGLGLHSHVYSAAALAEYVRTARLYRKPQRGDIVFFNFAADPGVAFNGPHLGIVIDTSAWDKSGKVLTVEAQVSSGLPKGAQLNDGVYKRVRYSTDVLGFGRPVFVDRQVQDTAAAASTFNEALPTVTAARALSGKPNRDVTNIQLALAALTDARDMNRGTWCPATKAAFARYQRMIGFVGTDVDGMPTDETLGRLGRETKLFNVR
jgi:hypothetical protein